MASGMNYQFLIYTVYTGIKIQQDRQK